MILHDWDGAFKKSSGCPSFIAWQEWKAKCNRERIMCFRNSVKQNIAILCNYFEKLKLHVCYWVELDFYHFIQKNWSHTSFSFHKHLNWNLTHFLLKAYLWCNSFQALYKLGTLHNVCVPIFLDKFSCAKKVQNWGK